ncbi:MAG: exonuclease SbcCD subunit D [Vulcanimicrobiota bacterium]
MRLLHTSDWHIGVTTRGVSRAGDLACALDELLELCGDFKPDLILHSGDLFHQPRPQVDELELAWSGLRRLAEHAPVVVIAGNHDSPQLFDFFSQMLGSASKIQFVGYPKAPSAGGILKFPLRGGEMIKVACMPFVHANRMLPGWDGSLGNRLIAYSDRIMRLQKAYAESLQKSYSAQRDILIYAAHLFVDGASLSTSERSLHVSDTYATRASAIPPVSYAAFGHIHKPQALPGGAPGRYAGSLIPIDFGEENDVKETVLVEALPGSAARLRQVPFRRGRKLLTLEGSKAALEVQSAEDCLLRLRVHTSGADPGLADWAARAFPKAEIVEVCEVRAAAQAAAAARPAAVVENLSLRDAFAAYALECGLGSDLVGLVGDLESLLDEEEVVPALPELSALSAWTNR